MRAAIESPCPNRFGACPLEASRPKLRPHRHATPAVLAFLTLIAGCGGGSGGGTPAPSGPAPANTGALNLCGNATTITEVVAKLNAKRTQPQNCRTAGAFAATVPLVWNARLAEAADAHSADMATQNYFAHTSPGGSTVGSRVTASAYLWSRVGENIAGGQTTVDAVIDGWMASDGHCANIMNPDFRDYGFSCAFNSASTYRTYWTQVFAAPQ